MQNIGTELILMFVSAIHQKEASKDRLAQSATKSPVISKGI